MIIFHGIDSHMMNFYTKLNVHTLYINIILVIHCIAGAHFIQVILLISCYLMMLRQYICFISLSFTPFSIYLIHFHNR